MALLEVQNLTVDFDIGVGSLRAVDDISFTIDAGEALGLVGESGSGKTVTALSIMRLLDRSAKIVQGHIWFDGQDLAVETESAMQSIRGRRIGMVFQEPMTSLNPAFTVGEQVAEVYRYHLQLSSADARRRTIEMFERVKLPGAREMFSKYPHEFSGGMRQRVTIAAALACRPSLLIADEPTTAVDVTIQAQILSLLRELQRDLSLALLFISHDLAVVSELCTRAAVLYGAQLLEVGSTNVIFTAPNHPYTAGLIRSIPQRGQPLQSIPGTIFDLRTPPSGCRFHPRCIYAQPRCSCDAPSLTKSSTNFHTDKEHVYACHYPLGLTRR
jgi:oligopeptide/dipeptide ABC transporter ATP-binding protein